MFTRLVLKKYSRGLRVLRFTLLSMVALLILITSAQATPFTQRAFASSTLFSPQFYVNEDGTLSLPQDFSGSFDLRGWDVRLDPARGPILSPTNGDPHAPHAFGDWSALGSNRALNNGVSALAVMGTDVYVGGSFWDVDNNGTVLYAADSIVKWDGTNWSALGSNGAGDGSIYGNVYALAVIGSNLYVGGFFFNLNNSGTVLNAADNIAKWDGTNWSALGSNGAGNGSLNNGVQALAAIGTNLYVGGSFTDVNNNGTVLGAADFIAKWDTLSGNWSALGSNGTGDGSLSYVSNSCVYALAVSGSNLYVGGYFINVNNNGTMLNAADSIAKWDGTNWSALGSNGAGGGSFGVDAGSLAAYIHTLAVMGNNLYVGGRFWNVNNNGTVLNAADHIAKWDGTNWSALGSNGAGDGSIGLGSAPQVSALAVIGSDLYVGGYFINVNNNGTVLNTADYIARWDGTNWSALSSNGKGDGSLNSAVYALAVIGSDLYVAGGFWHVNNNGTVLYATDRIAKFHPAPQNFQLFSPLIIK